MSNYPVDPQSRLGEFACNASSPGETAMVRLFMKYTCSALAGLAVLAGSQVQQSAPALAGIIDPHIISKSFPDCHDERVLTKIIKRFNWAEDNTFQRGFYLDFIERTRERVVQSSTQIPRRYCRGHARLTNGRHPTVFYLIEGGQGFAGNSFNVEFCLNGLDPMREHDGSCRVLRY